ncbi:hypothetical protein V495_02721 [Pseudogymnoascus sp. VKM F-4514 (FW-929)]|nr:hypothetical protein V495_02721 [Pseudogymnoascus sp. VKM F-4514 (FW-929)]KFY65420.1 hypothetical protein V497_01410 [Pseudogymnoascus sp. VKM F-4516 (FW-969)]
MSLSKTDILSLQFSLQQAVISCSERCQYQSAKWAAELLDSLPDDHDLGSDLTSLTEVFNTQKDPLEMRLERYESPKYLMAKALLDYHEPRRCAAVYLSTDSFETTIPLRNNVLGIAHGKLPGSLLNKISQRGLFLASYALLLAGEKEKTEELGPILGPSDTGAIINKQLAPLKRMLESWFDQKPENRRSQGWLEYLYGLVLAKDRSHGRAIEWLLKSILLYPWNWGAWLELSSLIRDGQHLNQVQSKLQPHIMAFIFSVHCRQELHQSSTAMLSEISQLQSIFPRSLFLQGQRALVFYRMKDLHTASTLSSSMLLSSPFHLDLLDHYSNILHTLNSPSRLALITHLATSITHYRPETCCAIGNYYSLSLRHEDAIHYFRLALQLDRNFASAWTLLGHEYVKLRNSHAAIEAYRRAVECNNKDYRALVGLGVVYEGLQRGSYALNYYRRALALRPDDGELWQMMGGCLTGMSKFSKAIEALKRGVACTVRQDGGDPEAREMKCKRIELLFQLANAYKELDDGREASKYLEICVEECDEVEDRGDVDESLPTAIVSVINQARLLLAQWLVEDGDNTRARYLASKVGQASEFAAEAQEMLRSITDEEDDGE